MIITCTIPESIEKDLADGCSGPAWSVWALATGNVHRGLEAASLIGYQAAPPESKPASGGETETYASADEKCVVDDEGVPDPSGPVILEKPARKGSGIQRVEGGLAEQIRAAEQEARELPHAAKSESPWELRALHIPALYFEAMWLHSLAGQPDLMLPYASGIDELARFTWYRAGQVLKAAARAAAKRPPSPAF